MMTIVTNTILHSWTLLKRVDFKCSHHILKKVTMYGEGCVKYIQPFLTDYTLLLKLEKLSM